MKRVIILMLIISIGFSCSSKTDNIYDVVIYGSTPAGIAAAVAAARNGKFSIIIDPCKQIGGMPASGISNLDFRTYESLGGFCKTFMDSATAYYRKTFGPESQELHDCWYGLNYEPKVALQIFQKMIKHDGIEVPPNHLLTSINQKNNQIRSISIKNLHSNQTKNIFGKIFIDATYEGDLMAMACEEYVLGAERRDTYNESLAPVEAFALHDVAPEKILTEKLRQDWSTMSTNKFGLNKKKVANLTWNSKTREDFLMAL